MLVGEALTYAMRFTVENGLEIDGLKELCELVAKHCGRIGLAELTGRHLYAPMSAAGYDLDEYIASTKNWDEIYEADQPPPWSANDGGGHPIVKEFANDGFGSEGRLLEIGAGDGSNACLIATLNASKVVGLDVSQAAIDSAKTLAATRGFGGQFICKNFLEYEVEDGSFDYVLDSWCFHHIPVHIQGHYVDRIAKLLRPGGQLLMLCHAARFSAASLFDDFAKGLWPCFSYIAEGRAETYGLSVSYLTNLFQDQFEFERIITNYEDKHIRTSKHRSLIVLMKRRI